MPFIDDVARNVKIWRTGGVTDELIVWMHGGYTPAIAGFGGTGMVAIPPDFKIDFYSAHGAFGRHTAAYRWILGQEAGADKNKFESLRAPSACINYALSTADDMNIEPHALHHRFPAPAPVRDYVVSVPGTKIHLSDIFDAIRYGGLPYRKLRYFACRVSKRPFIENYKA